MAYSSKAEKLPFDERQAAMIAEAVTKYFYDPLGFVLWAFPWGEEDGPLAPTERDPVPGPDEWQRQLLVELGDETRFNIDTAIQIARASGHGIGKSALVSWIILWFMTTRPNPQLVVTANTKTQLNSKTWRELAKWHLMSINRDMFEWQATTFRMVFAPKTWVATAIPWSANNPEAFAGTHEKYVLVIFDEASGIEDIIWEVTRGAMSTIGAIWICFGNPTKPTGRFRQCFPGGTFSKRWKTAQIDSREAKMTNKKEIQADIEDWGIDSDFVRIRWLGIFPQVGALQFIGLDLVQQAQRRQIADDDVAGLPLIMSVDIARHGDDRTVMRWRQGPKLWKKKRVMRIPDLMRIASEITKEIEETQPDIVFLDMVGIGAGVYDRLKQLGFHQVVGVQAGEKASEDTRYMNLRAEMAQRAKDWLSIADIPADDVELATDLMEPQYYFDNKERLYLEKKDDMKKRGAASPDEFDAVALSFAHKTPTRRIDEERYVEPEYV